MKCFGKHFIFVVLGLKCKVINNMSAVIDNLMECLTIEIQMERAKNILRSMDKKQN